MPCSWQVGLCAWLFTAREGLPSDASGSDVPPSAAALPLGLLPLSSRALSGHQGHMCWRQMWANLVEQSLVAPSDVLGAPFDRWQHIFTCQEYEDVPRQVVLVQADSCLHCSRDIVAHRLLCKVHLQVRSAQLAGEANARRPKDATWTVLPALTR